MSVLVNQTVDEVQTQHHVFSPSLEADQNQNPAAYSHVYSCILFLIQGNALKWVMRFELFVTKNVPLGGSSGFVLLTGCYRDNVWLEDWNHKV